MPATASGRLGPLLDEVATSNDLIHLLALSARLARSLAAGEGEGDLPHVLDALTQLAAVDDLGALVAIEAMAEIGQPDAARLLSELLVADRVAVSRHASWRLSSTGLLDDAIVPLAHRVTFGGIDTMHAHRTLHRWSMSDARPVLTAIQQLLPTVDDAAGRARLVELIGVIDHPSADADLLRRADDGAEAAVVRAAAIEAIGDRAAPGAERLLRVLARSDDELGLRALLALGDVESRRGRPDMAQRDGLRIAQLTLAGELDPQLTRGGRGDTGGVASLLVSLGGALAERDDVAQVLTIGRGTLTDAIADRLVTLDGTLEYLSLPLGDAVRPAETPSQLWEHVPAIERGLRRVLDGRGTDVLHLRMADAGTLAAAGVAEALGIDICFSLAPDPHRLIRSQQRRRELDRASFPAEDHQQHYWFRARLVEHLARTASRVALFPHRDTDGAIDLTPPADDEPRSMVVPEGIDIAPVRRAEADLHHSPPASPGPGGDVLDDLAARIPDERRQLPLVVSVGRLSPVKGMDRLVRNWADDAELRRSCTLVIVGGSLASPNEAERSVLAAIDEAVDGEDPAAAGLVLLGGRPRSDVARLLAATVGGHRPGWAPGGVYVNGAYKEEFGLAVLEALAAGLVVVAPAAGGPPTYVDDGDTGVLVDAEADLAPAIRRAFELVDRPGRATRARQLVESRYSIDRMADRLVELYRPAPALL